MKTRFPRVVPAALFAVVFTGLAHAQQPVVPEYNPQAPSYIAGGSPRNDYSAVRVAMPPPIPLGTYPGIFLTRAEIRAMQDRLRAHPGGRESLEKLMAACDAWLAEPVVHPDPSVPAQVRDRGDTAAEAHDLLSKKVGWLGWAYQFSGNEAYAAKAREILVGYARLYPNEYREHKGVNRNDSAKVMAQRLSEAMWILPMIQGYDLIHDAAVLTDADRVLIERDLIRHCLEFINRKRSAAETAAERDRERPDWRTGAPTGPKKTIGNWTNFYNAAFVCGGIVLRDQDWIDIGMANTRANLHTGIGEDGMWGEGAIGYHLFGRRALVACVEPLARKGVDLYGFESCIYKNLFDTPLSYAYPDGTAPGINDSGRTAVGGSWTAMDYDYAYLRYRDPNYGAIVNAAPRQVFQSSSVYFPTVIYEKLPEAPLAGLRSLIFDSLGYAILRGEGGGGPTYLLMDYGPSGGVHGHPDKLNLILFADGDELAGEPQGYRYEDARHAEWTRPTIAHWTLAANGESQSACTGRLLAFADFGPVKVVRGTTDQAYAGIALDRTVIQLPGYLVDVFRGWGPGARVLDYPLCFRGALDTLQGIDPESLQPMGAATSPGYKHLRATAGRRTDADWTGTWVRAGANNAGAEDGEATAPVDGPASRVGVRVLGAPGTEVFAGVVPGGRHQAVLRRTGPDALFAAIVDPYRNEDAVRSVTPFEVEGPVRAYGMRVERADGGTDTILVRWDPQAGGRPAAASRAPGIETDALVAVVCRNAAGEVVHLGMVGGTRLTAGAAALVLETAGIAWK